MIFIKKLSSALLTTVFLITLIGCQSVEKAEEKPLDIASEIENKLKAFATKRLKVDRALRPTKVIKIPRNAPWLSQRINVSYRDADAKETISLVLDDQPTIFDLTNDSQPLVTSSPRALTLKDHLDSICVQTDWSYTIDNGVVVFSDVVTETLFLDIQPKDSVGSLVLNSLNNNSSFSPGGENSMVTINAYEELNQSISNILKITGGGEGGSGGSISTGYSGFNSTTGDSYSLSKASNALVVTAKPSQVRKIRRVVEQMNYSVTRDVALRVMIYEIRVNASEEMAFDTNLIRFANIAASLGTLPSNIIDLNESPSTLALEFLNADRAIAGSDILLQWLNTQGTASVKLDEQVIVSNNKMFSVVSARTTPYISEVSLDRTDSGGTSTVTPDIATKELQTGLSFHLLPTIVNDRVNITLQFSRQDLVRFNPFSFGSVQGELPITEGQNQFLNVSLNNGETKIVANLKSTQILDQKSKTPYVPFLGSGKSKSNMINHTLVVVSANILK